MRWAEKGYTRAKRAEPDHRCGAQRSAVHQARYTYMYTVVVAIPPFYCGLLFWFEYTIALFGKLRGGARWQRKTPLTVNYIHRINLR